MARTIAVTGAASGIGKATADVLEAAGHSVIRIDLKEGDITGNLGDLAEVQRVADEVSAKCNGVLDALVANAGVSAPNELSVKVNFIGTVALIEALRPILAKSDAPRISVTSSAATLQGNDPELVDLLLNGDYDAAVARGAALAEQGQHAGYANYPSSKRAISRWVRRVAPTPEYAGAGIGINAVAPGQVITAMTRELFATPESRKMVEDAMPTPFNGPSEAEDIAAVHAFLISPENSSMTGQVIFVDAGFDALRRGDDIFTSV